MTSFVVGNPPKFTSGAFGNLGKHFCRILRKEELGSIYIIFDVQM